MLKSPHVQYIHNNNIIRLSLELSSACTRYSNINIIYLKMDLTELIWTKAPMTPLKLRLIGPLV